MVGCLQIFEGQGCGTVQQVNQEGDLFFLVFFFVFFTELSFAAEAAGFDFAF